MADTRKVLVTSIGGYGEQIVKALRLSRKKYEIWGSDASGYLHQARLVDHFVNLPMARESSYIDAVTSLVKKSGISMVFPGHESELALYCNLVDEKQRINGVPYAVTSLDSLKICSDKARTVEHLRALGFRVPVTWHRADILAGSADVTFPAVLKPMTNTSGSRDTYVVQSTDELRLFATFLGGRGIDFLAQEYVGSWQQEYTVSILHTLHGEYVNGIAMHRDLAGALHTRIMAKNTTDRRDLGDTLAISTGVSHGRIGRLEPVVSACRRIASCLGARGAINVQCRLVEGEVVPFEINPRFSGTTSLRALAGYNEPDIIYESEILGITPQIDFPYREITVKRGLDEFVMGTGSAKNWREYL
jgi:carbamoyl-phosphate synthase large subunit